MHVRIAVVTVLMLVGGAVAAHAQPAASGTIETRKIELKVNGAYGYWADSEGEKILRVAISNAGFRREALDRWFDIAALIHDRFVDDDTKVLNLEFTEKGRLRGYSYYFEPGDGCGYCANSKIKSTVKMSNGHLEGRVSYKERGETVQFDITFNVVVPDKVWGTPIHAGGGEFATIYDAYRKALAAADPKGLKATTDAGYNQEIADHEKNKDLKQYLEYRWDDVHMRQTTVRIVGGFERGDVAVLLVDGSSRLFDHLHGDVTMKRENGKWLVTDELFQVGQR
jgi:hypothetical protein